MKRRIIALILLFGIITAFTMRVIYVNSHSLAPELISYKMNTKIEIEDDFFDNSSENMNGYSITILDTEIIPIDEFQKQYSDYNNDMNAEYIYLVRVCFENENNNYGNSAGINLGQYILQEGSYINFIDREAYELINGFDSIKFSLRINSEMEMVIPFHVDSRYINVNKLKTGQPTLVVSLYPHKKVIILN